MNAYDMYFFLIFLDILSLTFDGVDGGILNDALGEHCCNTWQSTAFVQLIFAFHGGR